MLALLGYVEELLDQLERARRFHDEAVRELLLGWAEDYQGPETDYFEAKCRELTGDGLRGDEPAHTNCFFPVLLAAAVPR